MRSRGEGLRFTCITPSVSLLTFSNKNKNRILSPGMHLDFVREDFYDFGLTEAPINLTQARYIASKSGQYLISIVLLEDFCGLWLQPRRRTNKTKLQLSE